ncbi:hypothetical protein [Enterococcus termitis]|uniref:Uncharacterized protein n=1 Tax=Enterococcus termitis TaxID=332950 RepID=A0A1E5G8Y9_9ENTE|nr:hypothetical protein [Enterococcus termitis]OEG09111.1 hypothetical protein BCR25_11110 [Enterococcus termitis]OJG98568.1 hypothetical protein RV18_GL002991 [Enterococcus termitis]
MENIAELLAGRWVIKGTTFPMWLSKKRLAPMIAYEYLSDTPLTFLDIVSYKNRQGKTKTIVGIDTWREEAFVWRGKGLLRILKSNWSILALTKTILVIRFEPTLFTPAGIDVLVRQDAPIDHPEQLIKDSPKKYALKSSEVEGLVWL